MNTKRLEFIQFRVSEIEKRKIKQLAKVYAEGDVSAWLRWSAVNAERKFIKKRGSKRDPRERVLDIYG